jgi:hypothetical protein
MSNVSEPEHVKTYGECVDEMLSKELWYRLLPPEKQGEIIFEVTKALRQRINEFIPEDWKDKELDDFIVGPQVDELDPSKGKL